MIVSKKTKLVSMVAFLLIWIFGEYLVDLFPPSTAGRFLSLLFVTIVGAGSGYISIFASTEEDSAKKSKEDIEHRVFICDGKRPDNEVSQEAMDWFIEDPENRKATVQFLRAR